MDHWYDRSDKSYEKSKLLENKKSFLCYSTSSGEGYSVWWFFKLYLIDYRKQMSDCEGVSTKYCFLWLTLYMHHFLQCVSLSFFVHESTFGRHLFDEIPGVFGHWWGSSSNGKLCILYSNSWGLFYISFLCLLISLDYSVHSCKFYGFTCGDICCSRY